MTPTELKQKIEQATGLTAKEAFKSKAVKVFIWQNTQAKGHKFQFGNLTGIGHTNLSSTKKVAENMLHEFELWNELND